MTTTRLDATLRSITQDKRVTVEEARKISPAVLADLANSPDGAATLTRAWSNLKALGAAMDGRNPSVTAEQGAGRMVVYYLATYLEQFKNQMDAQGVGLFELAAGLAFRDGKVTASELVDVKAVADRLISRARHPAQMAGVLRQALAKVESGSLNDNYTKRDPADVMDASGAAALGRLEKTLASRAGNTGFNPHGAFVKEFAPVYDLCRRNDMGGIEAITRIPHTLEAELALHDSEGASPGIVRSQREGATRHVRALLHHLGAENPDQPNVTNIVGMYAWGMATGHAYAPGDKKAFEASLTGKSRSELTNVAEQYDWLIAQLGVPFSTASRNLLASFKEARALNLKAAAKAR